MEDATVTFFKSKLSDDSDRLATMERHLAVLDTNRDALVKDIDKMKKGIEDTKGLLDSMSKKDEPAAPALEKAKA